MCPRRPSKCDSRILAFLCKLDGPNGHVFTNTCTSSDWFPIKWQGNELFHACRSTLRVVDCVTAEIAGTQDVFPEIVGGIVDAYVGMS